MASENLTDVYSSKGRQRISQINVDEDFIKGQTILNSSIETAYSKCLEVFNSSTEPKTIWTLQPKPCGRSVSIVIIIKSSTIRNSLRHTLRKTWAQDVSADFGK